MPNSCLATIIWILPDRVLCLPTFSHFLIVNKTSLSLSLSPLSPTHHHHPLPPSSHFPTSPLLPVVQSSTVNPPTPLTLTRTLTRRPTLSLLGGGHGRLPISTARRVVAAACAALEAFAVKERLRLLVAAGAENLDLPVALRNSEKLAPFRISSEKGANLCFNKQFSTN
jgi:hypothetical protein